MIENCFLSNMGRNGIDIGYATNVAIQGNYITNCPQQNAGFGAANAIDVETGGATYQLSYREQPCDF